MSKSYFVGPAPGVEPDYSKVGCIGWVACYGSLDLAPMGIERDCSHVTALRASQGL